MKTKENLLAFPTMEPRQRQTDNRKVRSLGLPFALFAAASSLGVCAVAATQNIHVDPVTHNPPGASKVIRLYPGVAPGSEGATQVEVSDDGLRVRNVTVPELLVYKPRARTPHTGAAVIVAPGGGFQHLSIVSEGSQVAERLAAVGITGIVLKYRTSETAAAPRTNLAPGADARDEFARGSAPGASGGGRGRGAGGASGTGRGRVAGPLLQAGGASGAGRGRGAGSTRGQGQADGAAAMRYVRTHAVELGVSPDRVGFVGFSAGASIAMTLEVTTDPDVRPDFVGAIYSGAPPSPILPDAPPLFLAVAADDTTVGASASVRVVQDFLADKRPIELHIFNSGAHGFGMSEQGKTSDHWCDEFIWWLTAPNGLVKLATK